MRNFLIGAYYGFGKLLALKYAASEVDMFDFQKRFTHVADMLQHDGLPVTITWNDPASERYAAAALVRLQGRELNASHSHVNTIEQYAIRGSNVLGVVFTYKDENDESIGAIKHAADRMHSIHSTGKTYILRVKPFRMAQLGNGSSGKGSF